MIKILFYTLLNLLLFSSVYSQPITLTGKVYPPVSLNQSLLVEKLTRNPVTNEFDKLYQYLPTTPPFTFFDKISTDSSFLYWLNYGGGVYEIFIAPSDSMNITYNRLSAPDTVYLPDGGVEHNVAKLVLGGNNIAQFCFNDSLDYNTGRFISFFLYKGANQLNWEKKYKDSINALYNKRIEYLNSYCKKYDLSKRFQQLWGVEIKANYWGNLMAATWYQSKSKFPSQYFAKIDSLYFNWNEFKYSNEYSTAVWQYVTQYLNSGKLDGTKESYLSNTYQNIITKLNDDSIRNYELTLLMSQKLEAYANNYEEYLEKYKQDCTNKEYINGIENIHNQFIAKYNNATLNKKLLSNTWLKSYNNNNEINLKQLLSSKKPVLLDFWASWCGPCIYQQPFSYTYEQQYKNKIDFIYVSVDENENKWKDAIKTAKLKGNQYLLKKDRKSDFAKFLKITSVPRIVLIINGKIQTFLGALPNNPTSFQKMLDDCLK